MWYAFRELYRNFREGKLKESDGVKAKAAILSRYNTQHAEYETMQNIVRHQAEMWKQIELAGNRYGTDRTLENADAFVEAVYGVQNGPRMSAEKEGNVNERGV